MTEFYEFHISYANVKLIVFIQVKLKLGFFKKKKKTYPLYVAVVAEY
jgi:hypothetical protein